MNAVEIITRKRDGERLSDDEIGWIVASFASGQVPDYQMAAWSMAVFLNGMDDAEVSALTRHMLNSGDRLQHVDDGRLCVDKHSTGGIGDKTSLVLAPLLACCDLRVPMLSGRGLGPTGGTLDKLEAIPGFRTDLSVPELQAVVQQVGCVITGASAELAPADQRLYALRDVTATVPSVPLITASIMSKKLAESLNALVLDVKFGAGAFMKTPGQARVLADSLCRTGNAAGVPTTALLTDMNQPLGRMCGNALEVLECLDFLRGADVAADLHTVTIRLAAELLVMTKRARTHDEATGVLVDHIASGRAMERFEQMVRHQGGATDFNLTVAPATELTAAREGFIGAIDTEELGNAIIDLGGGRRTKTDALDHSTGLEMLVRIGDQVSVGQPLVRVFAAEAGPTGDRIQAAIRITDEQPPQLPLVAERVSADDDQ